MKKSVIKLIEKADEIKKVNSLDLSSDQDLTVALMNLIEIEETTTGALREIVRDVRKELLARVVTNKKYWCISKRLLGQSMHMINMGNKKLQECANDGYELFNRSYELYSLFWGVNMGLVSMDDVKKSAPDVFELALTDQECK